jgi:hypothetical protein
MKKLLYVLCPLALALGACNMADEKDFDNMAADVCGCVNNNTGALSDGMKQTIIDADKNGEDLQQAVMAYAMKNPEQGMKDAEAMTGLEKGMEGCMKDLEKKYNDVYSTDTEDEIQKKLIEKLAVNKDCAFTYAIVKMGLELEKQGK